MSSFVMPERRTSAILVEEIDAEFPAQLRAAEDERAIEDYARALGRGDEFPMPVVVTSDTGYVVVDGHHRVKAMKRAGIARVVASIIDTPPDVAPVEFARLLATRFNNQHGVRKSRQDRHSEALTTIPLMLRMGMRNREMARVLDCDEKSIRNWRRTLPEAVASADDALRAALGLDSFVPPQAGHEMQEIESELSPLGDGQDTPTQKAIAPNVSKELVRRIGYNRNRLKMPEADALALLMATASLLARMESQDSCAVVGALYTLQAGRTTT